MPPCISSGSYRFLGTLDGKDLPEALSWYHPYRCPVPYLSPHELNLGPLYKDLITKALRILANSFNSSPSLEFISRLYVLSTILTTPLPTSTAFVFCAKTLAGSYSPLVLLPQ